MRDLVVVAFILAACGGDGGTWSPDAAPTDGPCAPVPHATVYQSARCPYRCDEGRGDCDGDRANGCETLTTTLTHCGGCRNACAATDTQCVYGVCAP